MNVRKKTLASLRKHVQHLERTALEAKMESIGQDGQVRVAGEVPVSFKPESGDLDNEVGGHVKRAIPKDFDYDPKALKPLAKMSFALSIALGHAMTAHREFTKIKSATISPDGMVGGRGYVMSVKDVRKTLHDACEALSAVADTIHDEIHGPHWRPKLAELEKDDLEVVERLVGEADKTLEDPEAEVQDELAEAEQEGDRAEMEEDEVSPGSEVPNADDSADSESAKTNKTASASLTSRVFQRWANSSVPVQTVPGGPRVQHMDRGDVDQTGPFGSYNTEEPHSINDQWSKDDGVGDEYLYKSEWENDLSKDATSTVPDSNSDSTPTQGWDFGIGYGQGNDAHGQGAGGYANPDSDGKGVFGPSTQLPNDPGRKRKEDSSDDSTLMVELSVGRKSAYDWKAKADDDWQAKAESKSKLPSDDDPGVARSDYYQGDKPGNQFNVVRGESEVPDSGPRNDFESDMDVHPGLGYRFEQGTEPYLKWDDDTHNMRPDAINQSDDEGPYVKEF